MNSENPYRSPQAHWEPSIAARKPVGRNEGLAWLLFSFRGRIPRSTFWGTSILTGTAFFTLALMLAVTLANSEEMFLLAVLLLYIPAIWISLAIQAKRWHDRNKSAWWLLTNLIPYLGPFWILVELGCLRGSVGPNLHGPDPTGALGSRPEL